jgi:hypothetical protein
MNVEIGTEAVQFPEKEWDFPCNVLHAVKVLFIERVIMYTVIWPVDALRTSLKTRHEIKVVAMKVPFI